MADYFEKLKSLFGEEEKPSSTKQKIVFSPEELREMRDPSTAVGRLLNPQDKHPFYDDNEWHKKENYPYAASELFEKGTGSFDRSISKEDAYNEAVRATAEAYLKDAEKKGVAHPDEDRISKVFNTIENLKKEKGLEDIKIQPMANISHQGIYHNRSKTAQISDRYSPILHPDEVKGEAPAKSIIDILSGKPAPKPAELSSQEKQKIIENKQDGFLNAAIHELRHAEDYKKYGADKVSKSTPRRHFMESFGNFIEDPHDTGKKDDIQRAALHRLMGMGTEKKQEPKPESESESQDQKYIREALKKLGVE